MVYGLKLWIMFAAVLYTVLAVCGLLVLACFISECINKDF